MSKNTKKSKGGAPIAKSAGLFTDEDKGPHAVIVADLHARRFDPLTRKIAHCLLPLAGVPLLHYSLSRLVVDGFRNIIVYACAHTAQVQQFVHSYQTNNDLHKDTRILVHSGESCRSLGDVMRDLDSSQLLRGVSDFLLVPADLICARSLLPFVTQHQTRRVRNPAAILSLVMPHANKLLSPAQSAEWTVSVLLSLSMDNRIIKLFPTCVNPAPNILLQELVKTDHVVELSSNLFDLGVAVCSNHVAPLFQDNFDYQTMGDLIHDVLTNEEVMGYTMHVDRMPPGPMMLCAAPDLRTLIEFSPHILSRDSGIEVPLTDSQLVTNNRDSWIAHGPQIYVARSARIDPTAQLIGSCLIGPASQVGAHAVLIDCVIGADCHVGNGARLRRVVSMSCVQFGDRVRADTAWICSHAVILFDMHLSKKCFIGPSPEDGPRVTLGPGPGSLSPRAIIVAPGQSDIIVDPVVGGSLVWASLFSGKNRVSDQFSENDDSDDSSNDTPALTDQRPLNSCALWDSAEDRIRSAVAKLRRSRARTRGQSSTSETVASQPHQRRPSGKLTRKSVRTVSTAGTDIDRLSGPSDDEGEQSEAFLVGELRHTLEHSQGAGSEAENVILEVNSLKHAYNVLIDDLYFLLTKAILDVTRTHCHIQNSQSEMDKTQVRAFVTEFKTQLNRFHTVLQSYFGQSVQASRMCLQALEDSACYNPLLMEASPYLMHALYDADLIIENAIWWWTDHSPLLSDEDLAERTKLLREKLEPFLSWLREAESEEEEDDDDEEEE
ncbi:Translation initiation factor eIF-2B subunit epsilon [Fasciola hepatica]|uniref:Translation initiation factor eIF2B subunit epsilon n=1 Tax=Fasciola hepatica TaxID=6192 RepID=A0A4E0S2Y0_FASHE|nr:Translation initiation factor eIF-2B subunit epsilon [Fasciola hepatica]